MLHPSLALTRGDWCRHVLLAGSPGSGKTQILLPIVAGVIARKARALVLDSKGDYTAALSVSILNPWDARSRYWDIAQDLLTVSDAEAFAAALVPLAEGGDQHWDAAARAILAGAVVVCQQRRGRAWGWRALAAVLRSDISTLADLLGAHYPEAVPMLGKGSDKTEASTRATLATHTRAVSLLARAWGDGDVPGRGGKMRRVSLRAWASDEYTGTPVITLHTGPDMVTSQRWLAAAYSIAAQALLALPDSRTRQVFLVLDELPAAGKIPPLASLIERGRSKGVCVVAGFQDLAQLRLTYGRETAQSLASMMATQVWCQVSPGETRDQLADWAGKRRVAIPTLTRSGEGSQGSLSSGIHEEQRALVTASDLTSELGFRVVGGHKVIRALVMPPGSDLLVLDFPVRTWPPLRRPHVAAAWTLPAGDTP